MTGNIALKKEKKSVFVERLLSTMSTKKEKRGTKKKNEKNSNRKKPLAEAEFP